MILSKAKIHFDIVREDACLRDPIHLDAKSKVKIVRIGRDLLSWTCIKVQP